MKTRVIVNPSAGAGRAAQRVAATRSIFARAWGDVEWCESRSADHLADLAREAAAAGYERVVCAGGDGTIHHALGSLAGTRTALGVLPVGTGNDFVSTLGLPLDTLEAARALVDARVVGVDLGSAGSRFFCCVLGIGMDTVALRYVNASRWRRGRLLYNWAAVRTLCTYRPESVDIVLDDQRVNVSPIFIALANTYRYAGGIPVAPTASIDDGLLDLCVIPRMSLLRRLRTFALLKSARHVDAPGVLVRKVRTARFLGDTPLPVTLDGELTDLRTPIEATVRPAALRVLVGTSYGVAKGEGRN